MFIKSESAKILVDMYKELNKLGNSEVLQLDEKQKGALADLLNWFLSGDTREKLRAPISPEEKATWATLLVKFLTKARNIKLSDLKKVTLTVRAKCKTRLGKYGKNCPDDIKAICEAKDGKEFISILIETLSKEKSKCPCFPL